MHVAACKTGHLVAINMLCKYYWAATQKKLTGAITLTMAMPSNNNTVGFSQSNLLF